MQTEIITCTLDSTTVPGAILDHDPIRAVERASIRAYVNEHSHLLTGRVLDFGCGLQPYRSLITGVYHGFDKSYYPTENEYEKALDHLHNIERFNTILCTQVLEYYRNPFTAVALFSRLLITGGYLICTYPTNWDEVEQEDLQRLTMCGMHDLLTHCGFEILNHTRRAEVKIGNFRFPLGYGVVARKPTYKA